MNKNERLVIFALILAILVLLPLTVKAASEQEMVDEFISKYEKKQAHRMLVPYFTLSYGKVDPKSYHRFVDDVNEVVDVVNPSGPGPLASVYRITSFEGGCGIVVDRGMLSFGFNYWLTVGSANQGDFRIYSSSLPSGV